MPIPRYAARKDKVQSPIVDQLRDIPGVSVEVISAEGIGDILVGREDMITGEKKTFLIELKSKHGKLTPKQIHFRENWKGQHDVCETLEQVLKIIGF